MTTVTASGDATEVQPDAAAIRAFAELLFGNVEGYVPLRILSEKGGARISPQTPFVPANDVLAEVILRHVEHAARLGAAAYVVPGTVARPGRARAEDIVQLTTVLVDLDEGDVAARRTHLVRFIGEPSFEVASGGLTDEGEVRLHLYWRLTRPAAGQDLTRVCRLREELAEKVGGDRSFASPHQPIRIAGSVYCKLCVRRPVRILHCSGREVDLAELADAIAAMPMLAGSEDCGTTTSGAGVIRKPTATELLGTHVREGGIDGITRFAALSSVIGYFIRRAREGQISLEIAWNDVCGYNRAKIDPPWPEDQLRREFLRLLDVDQANHRGELSDRASRSDEVLRPSATEDELAELFSHRHGHDWRYCPAWGQWLEWSGAQWRPDERGRVLHLVRLICRDAAKDAPPRIARRIASAATAAAVERFLRTDPRHATSVAEWDADPWLLNTPAGVVDLRTGEARAHNGADRLTRCARAVPGHGCPAWLGFIDTVTGGDRALGAYLARVAGYCLTGLTTEHAFFLIHGTGANGKSVFLSVLLEILGSYATTAPLDSFMASLSDRHSADLAGLHGARLVAVSETEPGRRWAETKLKAVTGGDRVKARFLYRDFFEFTPAFKLIIAGNHRPELRDTGEAVRRRLQLIPFAVTIPPAARDQGLTEKLLAERDGILAWMIEGCRAWRGRGLQPPPAVRQATEDYFSDQDRIGRWLVDACLLDAGASTPVGELYASFRAWAMRCGEDAGSAKAFSQAMQNRGFQRARSAARAFRGLRLAHATRSRRSDGDGQ